MKKILIVLISILMISGCYKQPEEPQPEPDPIKELMATMTLEEKVGQMFFIRVDSLDFTIDLNDANSKGPKKLTDTMIDNYYKYPCGGFCIFNRNISSPKQLIKLNEQLHSLGNITPLIFIDEEGGRIARIANSGLFDVEKFPSMEKIAKNQDYETAYNLGKTIGEYLTEYGFDGDFAPVADVNTNSKNIVIGNRAFGSDPNIAGDMVTEVIKGLHASNILSTIKHFPGHGDTKADTHKGYAQTTKTWEEMLECEMIPFKAGIEAGTELVMVAHIAAPNVTGNNDPATFSYTLVTEKLRNELGFNGVIITDGMEMKAISKYYNSAQASIKAIQAGVDIILLPSDYRKAFDGVVKAVNEGEISIDRIDESVYRILSIKRR